MRIGFLSSLYKAVKGEKAWPPLAMFKAGGTSKLLRKGHRHLPAERLEAHNRSLCPIRARIEKIFGTWKRTYSSDACDRLALPRQNSRSISRSSLTTANGIGACKPPERTYKAGLQRGSATLMCKTARQQSPSRRRYLIAQLAIFKAPPSRTACPTIPDAPSHSAQQNSIPRTGLDSRETLWYDCPKKLPCAKPRDDHRGILPCFFQGFWRFLLRSMASARATRFRVSCGMMTSSI
jgi:hypothetical protein